MKTQDWMTIPEVAKELGISRIATYRRVKKGQIPARRLGRTYYVSRRQLPYLLGTKLTQDDKERIRHVVMRAVRDYGDVFVWLSKE